MTQLHKGHRERLKNRFRNEGLASFSEHEVLELILMYAIPQKDVNPLAHELIRYFGSLQAVLEADYGQLVRFGGVGDNTATLIKLIGSSTQYAQLKGLAETVRLHNSRTAGRYCAKLIGSMKQECLAMLSLGGDMKLIKAEILQSGSFNETSVNPRSVAQAAMRSGAAAVILSHNHPSGSTLPSQEDIKATSSLSSALAMLDICLADHIIVSGNEHYSMFANKHFVHAGLSKAEIKLANDMQSYR